jgi:hypothetical protein
MAKPISARIKIDDFEKAIYWDDHVVGLVDDHADGTSQVSLFVDPKDFTKGGWSDAQRAEFLKLLAKIKTHLQAKFGHVAYEPWPGRRGQ